MSFNGQKNTAYGVYGIESNGFANPTHLAPGTNTSTTLGYLANVTSDIQTQLNNLAPIASPTFTGTVTAPVLDLTNNINQLVFGTTNTLTFTMAALTASRTCTFPDANSNTVQPSSGSTNQFVNAISSAGVISYGFPGILNDVQAAVTNTGITISTDIIVAIAPLLNANGYYILVITNGADELTIQYQLKLTQLNISQQPVYLVNNVYDTRGIITKDNLSNYLTFIAYYRTSTPNPYIAVTVRMTGGLLYAPGTTYKYTATCYTESFLSDNTAITQYLCKNVTNLPAANSIYKLNGTTVQYSTFPASSLFLYAAGGGGYQEYATNSSTGGLTNLGNFPATGALDIVATPNGQVVFITNTSGAFTIFGYTVNIATGALTLATTNSSGASSLQYMAIHPNGNFLYLTALAGIYMYSISGTTLTALSPASIANGSCIELTMHPNGQYLYAAGGGNNVIYQFNANASTGQLTAMSPASVTCNSCAQVAIHPSGNFAYATLNISGAGSGVNVFAIDSTGHLGTSPLQTATSGNLPLGIAVTPNGLNAYAVNNGDNTISCYSINTTSGQLTNFATVSAQSGTSWIKIAPSGEYLYVTNKNAKTIQTFGISSTGGLTNLGPIAVSNNPNQLVII